MLDWWYIECGCSFQAQCWVKKLQLWFCSQVKLEIDVKAHIAPKKVVVEEAKNLKARYVVIDR